MRDVPRWLTRANSAQAPYGRFSAFGLPVNWISADILRIKDRILIEHWDVIQDETTQEQ